MQFSKRVLDHDVLLGLVRLFDLDQEANVTTWYSTVLLLLAAVLLAVIARAAHTARAQFRLHWALLALILLVMSVDEASSIHELAIRPLRSALGVQAGVLYFTWVVPAGAAVLLVGIAYLRFVLHLPAATRRLFVIAGGVYVGGALGLELIGGYLASHHGGEGLAYLAEVTIEETMEMSGAVLFIHGLMGHIRRELGEVRITFGAAGPAVPR